MSSQNPVPLQLTPAQLNYSDASQWAELLKQRLVDLRVAVPGIVQSFDPLTQTVSVQVAIREVVRTSTGPENKSMPVINNVPIVLARAGGFSLTLPIQNGDECLLIFADNCFDLWWMRGGVQNQIGRHRHEFWDCFCVLGTWSQPRVLSNYSTESAQLRTDDGSVVVDVAEAGITMTAPKVTINSSGDIDLNASGNVVIAGKDFVTHQHTGVQPGSGDTGPVL